MLYRSADIQTDGARRVAVEIGDAKQPALFYPQFKTLHWNNECNFSVRLQDPDYAGGVVRRVGDTVEWERAGRVARFYRKATPDEDGGFEFDVALAAKPATNVLRFTLQTKGLSFHFQPPLTPAEVLEGAVRPANVVGSYAVYHSTRAGNIQNRDGTPRVHYRTGKAFHIYRPEAIDALGLRTWCRLNIDEAAGLLTVTVPQAFLDTATYPVVVDPTFGYTSIGGTNAGYSGIPTTGGVATPPSSGDVTSITWYGKQTTGSGALLGVAIYSDNAGAPDSKLAEDSGDTTINSTAGWWTTNIALAVVGGTAYHLAAWVNASYRSYYDSGLTSYYRTGVSFESWPASFGGTSEAIKKRSHYATYTASGSSVPVFDHHYRMQRAA